MKTKKIINELENLKDNSQDSYISEELLEITINKLKKLQKQNNKLKEKNNELKSNNISLYNSKNLFTEHLQQLDENFLNENLDEDILEDEMEQE